MRFQRLLLEAGTSAVKVEFHPRLTVVAGVGELERKSLINELVRGLGGSRPGTHIEVVDDAGRRLGLVRSTSGAPDQVYDLETRTDVTEEFRGPDGSVDILAHLGLDLESARRRMVVTASDMAASAKVDEVVRRLAGIPQRRLWEAAEQVSISDAVLKAEAAELGADPDDAPLIQEIEHRHRVFEAAQRRLRRVRRVGLTIGGASVLAAIPAMLVNHVASLPLLAVAMSATLLSIMYRRRMHKAAEAERKALAAAGAETYIGFRLHRMNEVIHTDKDRNRLALAGIERRQALETWGAIAGDVSVDWALAKREQIVALARRLQADGRGIAQPGPVAADAAELAEAVIVRLNDLRHAGRGNESLPLILDEPLAGVEPKVKQWTLELIAKSSGVPQVVYLTEDPDVAAWARAEAPTGNLGVIEPAPEAQSV